MFLILFLHSKCKKFQLVYSMWEPAFSAQVGFNVPVLSYYLTNRHLFPLFDWKQGRGASTLWSNRYAGRWMGGFWEAFLQFLIFFNSFSVGLIWEILIFYWDIFWPYKTVTDLVTDFIMCSHSMTFHMSNFYGVTRHILHYQLIQTFWFGTCIQILAPHPPVNLSKARAISTGDIHSSILAVCSWMTTTPGESLVIRLKTGMNKLQIPFSKA